MNSTTKARIQLKVLALFFYPDWHTARARICVQGCGTDRCNAKLTMRANLIVGQIASAFPFLGPGTNFPYYPLQRASERARAIAESLYECNLWIRGVSRSTFRHRSNIVFVKKKVISSETFWRLSDIISDIECATKSPTFKNYWFFKQNLSVYVSRTSSYTFSRASLWRLNLKSVSRFFPSSIRINTMDDRRRSSRQWRSISGIKHIFRFTRGCMYRARTRYKDFPFANSSAWI